MATATLDNNGKFYWSITFTGLTGPASAALFHGPAAPGTTAGAMVNAGANTLDSPMKGSIYLTPGQITDLIAGNWYINVYTSANPDGEIRGQLMVV
jgi:hypothetical protein